MKGLVLVIVLAMLLLTACSVEKFNQESTMKGDYGMLKLVGDPTGRTVMLDGQVLTLDPKKEVNIFELKSGTYKIEVRANGQIVMNQNLFISTSQTNEVKLP